MRLTEFTDYFLRVTPGRVDRTASISTAPASTASPPIPSARRRDSSFILASLCIVSDIRIL